MIKYFPTLFSKPFFNNRRNINIVYVVAAILISLKIYFLETWDNYDCFSASFNHLRNNLDLYKAYPLEYQTFFVYSPSFAVFMGIYQFFPDGIGILLWNLTHTIAFLTAVHLLPISEKNKLFLLWFCLVEFITATENVQTNASVAALIMLVFVFQQKGKINWSGFFFALGLFFKIYVLTSGVFFLLFKKRAGFAFRVLAWSLVFFALPLLFISFDQLIITYGSWLERLQKQSARHSLSLLGVIDLFHIEALKQGYIIIAGVITMLLILTKKEIYHNLQMQLTYLGALLMFTIIFNPGVESPTYIIAVPGVVFWYLFGLQNPGRIYLLISVFVFTCLSPTEIFPRFIRDQVFNPLHIKSLPVIITWFVCIFELFSWKQETKKENVFS